MKQHSRPVLVLAHPGHELFLSAWIRQARPNVCVFTDGSGRLSDPRIETTHAILESIGAEPGPIFGRFSDKQLYQAILQGRLDLFRSLARDMADFLIENETALVVADGYERQFLAHDVCRLVAGSAVSMAEESLGRGIEQAGYPLYGYRGSRPDPADDPWLRFQLNDEELDWKLRSARSFPDPCLQQEIDELIETRGLNRFRSEVIFRVSRLHGFDDAEEIKPLYELHGEKLVEEGEYPQVVRYREHVQPIAEALCPTLRAVS